MSSNRREYDVISKLCACLVVKQEVSLKKIIVEGYRAVRSVNDSLQYSNFLLLLLLIDFSQW